MNKFINICVLLLITVGCTKVIDPSTVEIGYEFYPLEVGDYKIYSSVKTQYNLDRTIDTINYLLKEFVEEQKKYTDETNRFIVGRYRFDETSKKWRKYSGFSVLIDNVKVVVSEIDINYIKLIFPLEEGEKWNGNALNSNGEEFYNIENLRKAYTYDTCSYESTVTIIHKEIIDPLKITKDELYFEVFGKDVGFIYSKEVNINYCLLCEETGQITDGFITEQKLIESGKE